MRAGVLISAAAHAALIALVVRGLPWLRPHDAEPAPVVAVSLVSEAELAAAEAVAALPRGEVIAPAPPPAPPPEPPEAAEPVPEPPAAASAETDGRLGELISLAPAFDPERPLGLDGEAAAIGPGTAAEPDPGLLSAERPRPRPERARPATPVAERGAAGAADRAAAAGGAPGQSAADLRAGLAAGVHAALAAARVYPKSASDRGITGAATLNLIITRDGRLVAARLVGSSGSEVLDGASLAAARNARYPPAPAELPGARFSFTARVVFTP